jgi:hypothetical protein
MSSALARRRWRMSRRYDDDFAGGGGVAAFIGSGADVAVASSAGVAAEMFASSGADVAIASDAGVAAETFGASGADIAIASDAGVAAETFASSGADIGVASGAGAAAETFAASGADIALASAAGVAATALPWQTLVTALSLGSAGALYDGLVNVTQSGGVISALADARGSTGFAPTVQNAAGSPTYNTTTGAMTFNGTSQYMYTAASAVFDLSGPISFWAVMSGAGAGSFNTFGGISDTGLSKRLDIISFTGTVYGAYVGPVGNTPASIVSCDSTVRLVIVSNDSAHANVDVPAKTRVSATSALDAAGNNALTWGGYYQEANNPSVVLAYGVIPRVVTVGDITALKAYATAKGYTAA